jgi:hypothetical protein
LAVVNGVVQAKTVTLGPKRQDGVIVKDGLDGTETLVAQPSDSIKPGDRVKVSTGGAGL